MRIDLLADREVSPKFLPLAERLLSHAAEEMGIGIDEIEEVIISDEAHYRQAIERIEPGGTFTKDDVYVGVGKTVTQDYLNDGMTSRMVFRIEVLQGALVEALGLDPEGELEARQQAQMFLYCVYHELGHCLDYRLRPHQTMSSETGGRLRRLAQEFERYYIHILMEEFAATVFSAAFITAESYRSAAVDTLHRESAFLRDRAADLRAALRANRPFGQAESTVPQLLWRILIQFAKAVAMRVGNPKLQNIKDPVWPRPCADGLLLWVFDEFEERLRKYWQLYPNWTSSGPQFFFREAWDNLASLEGLSFFDVADELKIVETPAL